MLPTPKLTKRQKKGIAFRERKRGKSKEETLGIPGDLEVEVDVPSVKDQVFVDATQGPQGGQVSAKVLVRKRRGRAEGKEAETGVVVAARKRKRKASEETKGSVEPDRPRSKRRRGFDGSSVDDMAQHVVGDHVEAGETGIEKTKQRFILFLGNLKYTTTPKAIQTHFSACVPSPTVRLLTRKPSARSPASAATKSRGCAFLEFKHRSALQQGLRLHHSQLDGRQINVELTAGGGGRGLIRMRKLKERNKELEGQRRRRQDPKEDVPSNGTRRFSVTSGIEQTHLRKRTWTVGGVEEKETHRSRKRQKGSKKQSSSAKECRTGVNAIPVG